MANQPVLTDTTWIPWENALYIGAKGNDGIDAALGHGPSGNQATFAVLCNWDDILEVIPSILGEHFYDATKPNLNRILPKRHPVFTHLYASRITSIKPMVFTEKERRITGANFGKWRAVMLMVLFQQPRYAVLSDNGLDKTFPPVDIGGTFYRQEWMRFAEYTWASAGETLSRPASSMKWAEGTGAGGPPAQPTATDPFPSPMGFFLAKPDFAMTVRHWPYYGLFSPTTYRPENLLSAYNRVNSATFMSFPAGTLLLKGWQITMNECPYPSSRVLGAVIGANQGDEQLWPSITCDVTLQFSYFDPPHANSAYRGHNLAPHNSGNTTTEAPEWYLISSNGSTTTGSRLFGSYDYRKMWAKAT